MANIIKFGSGGGQKLKKLLQQIATQAKNVLSGTYFINAEGEVTEGSIPIYNDYQTTDHTGSTRMDGELYVTLSHIPTGYYQASSIETESWAPEIRTKASNFGNAQAVNVLDGKVFTSSEGLRVTGTMPNMTTIDSTIGGINLNYPNVPIRKGNYLQIGTTTVSKESLISIQVPKGYYDGGYVGVAATNLGTATRDQVLKDKTFTSTAGVKLSGTMTNNGALGTHTIAPGGSYTIPGGYTSGGTVKASQPTAAQVQAKTESVAGFTYRDNQSGQYGQSSMVALCKSDGGVTVTSNGTLTGNLLEVTTSNGDAYGSVTVKARKKVRAWGQVSGRNSSSTFNKVFNAGDTIAWNDRSSSVGVVRCLVSAVDATNG